MKAGHIRILGIDEAGRGCVIGPLVVAGVLIEEKSVTKLSELGVKDSKLLSSQKREKLAEEIVKIALDTCVVKLSPLEIDKAVLSHRKLHKLNRLEAQTMAKIIETLRPDLAIVDAADVLAERYKHHITECVPFQVRMVSEHRADRTYPAVSAASIVAKVERDSEIKLLRAAYGDFGSGYMSDPKTKRFLETLVKEFGEYPTFVRRSWKPAKLVKACAKLKQAKLDRAMPRA